MADALLAVVRPEGMSPSERPPMAAAYAVAAVTFVARLALFAGVELHPDEAYYWTWSLRPAFGYLDHPPMVAYLAWLGRGLPGETGLRVPFVLCGALTVVFTAYTARALARHHPRAPLWAALFAATTPMLTLNGALVVPDAPVQAAASALTWLFLEAQGPRWLAVGVAAGLALLSKYSGGLLALAVLPAAAVDSTLRAELRTRWPWLGVLVAALIFAPCLAWNGAHDFVSIRYQLRHGLREQSVARFSEFLAGLLAGVGPIVLAAAAVFFARTRTPAARRLLATIAVPLAVFVFAAFRGSAPHANWPAIVYPGLCAAAGAFAAGLAMKTARLIGGAAVVLAAALALVYAIALRAPDWLSTSVAPVGRFHGWRETATAVRRLTGEPDPFVVASNYQVAAELAFYGGFRRFGGTFRRVSQFDVWGAAPTVGERLVVVSVMPSHPPEVEKMLRRPGASPIKIEVRSADRVLRTVWITVDEGETGDRPGR
jgi:4-amino-4-deoxy-L-arabinose transferase-like glycosyltransferase